MKYFAHIKKQKTEEYLVSFPELEGCFTEGETLETAKKNASEALNGWPASNCDRKLNIPDPKPRKGRNYYPINVELQVGLPIILRKKRKMKHFSQGQVAKKLGITQQAYAKLEIPAKTNPSLSTLEKLLKALDIELYFNFATSAIKRTATKKRA